VYALKNEYFPNYTYDDYLLWEGKWELIYGIPYAMAPAPMIKHQTISNKIARYLDEALETCKTCQVLLPIDWKIDDSTIVQPDNLVICHEPQFDAYIKKAPKVIFEILSKSTATKDIHLKYELYEKEGVDYYVIVDPEESIAKVYKLYNGQYIKVCDAYKESIIFELPECKFAFDFSKIWDSSSRV
jgi:Uma2 family endonuclease